MQKTMPPQLPADIDRWSTRALAAWLGVSVSTVKYHARQAFRGHRGRWNLSQEQAQKVVNRIFHFGHTKLPPQSLAQAQTFAQSFVQHRTQHTEHTQHAESLAEISR